MDNSKIFLDTKLFKVYDTYTCMIRFLFLKSLNARNQFGAIPSNFDVDNLKHFI